MAFKLTYSFEGNYKTKPEQNLSGSSRKNTRDGLLQRAHEERQKRHDERVKLQSTLTLQSHIKSYLIRQHIKQEQRLLFDNQNEHSIHIKLSKLLFFYNPKIDDARFIFMCELLLNMKDDILNIMAVDKQFYWLMNRYLVLCLNALTRFDKPELPLYCIQSFTLLSNIVYLNTKGYFRAFRSMYDMQNPHPHADIIYKLVVKPFELYNLLNDKKAEILSQFCIAFLSPDLTIQVKDNLIPRLVQLNCVPYTDLITYLYENNRYIPTNSLLFSVLSLEPPKYAQNKRCIKVLSMMSVNLCRRFATILDVSEDSDIEEMPTSQENISLSDFMSLFNNSNRVKRILHYYMENSDDEELLVSLTHLCHNLLTIFQNSIRKFMLLYMLAIKGTFLAKLWNTIKKREENAQLTARITVGVWQETYMLISVFCNMFTFYTQTLTDSESTDTSSTFSLTELASMSELLKNFALNLIEVAFPLCRYNSVPSTPELVSLYSNCLGAVKMLYMLDVRKQFCKPDFWTKKKLHVQLDLLKKNYMEQRLIPFQGLILNAVDHLPPLSTIELRSLAVIKELPFLLDFNTRIVILRDLLYYSTDYDMLDDYDSHTLVVVRRTHLYEDTFEKISQKSDSQMRRRLRIQFVNNIGLEEAGIDGGGVFKEFINEVLKTAFDPNRGFFLLTADNTLYPNPNVRLIMENFEDHYFLIGRLVGKAVFENILVDLPLAEFFLAKILVDKASAHFLQSLDPVLYRNLLYLRDYTGDVQELGLDFTLVNNDLGETRVVELKPGGRNITVTNDNRLEYIHKLADLKLNSQISRQCAAFREGLNSVVPILWFRLFNYNELQVIISGDNQEIDIEDMKQNTVYTGDFTEEHPTIILFWKIVDQFTETQKKQLLKFATSCSRPPLLGFKELTPKFCIQCSGYDNRIPTASTCLNLLKIPATTDESILRTKLLQAIEQQSGFDLS